MVTALRLTALALVLSACGTSTPTVAPPATAQVPDWVRSVMPFSVSNDSGERVPIPFTGGFLEPKARLVNLVGDDRPDLLVSVGGASLQLFEWTDDGPLWRTDRLGDITPGNWFAPGDLDGDGRIDLLTYGGNGRVQFHRQTESGEELPDFELPDFELADDELRGVDGAFVYVEDATFPALTDIDDDGDLDLMSGTSARGNITYYRHDGLTDGGVPLFTEVTTTFAGIEIYEPNPSCEDTGIQPGNPSGGSLGGRGTRKHGSNALAFADLTGDQAPELLWGDFFSPSLYYFQNDGSAESADYRLVTDRFPTNEPLTTGGYNAPSLVDIDDDGDNDLLVGILSGLCATPESWTDNLLLFENTGSVGSPSFTLQTQRLVESLDVGRRSAPAATDLDGDGDLDLVIGNETDPRDVEQATLTLLRNAGTHSAPSFEVEDRDFLGLEYDFGGYAPTFGDLDADGDADLLVGGFNGRYAFLRNTGSATAPAFELESESFFDIDAGQYGRVALGDIDGDDDLDLITGASSGRVRLYLNTGTPESPNFTSDLTEAEREYAAQIGLPDDAGDDSAPALADVDGDGDLDLLVGTARQGIRVWVNEGTPTAPQFTEEETLPASRLRTTPLAADLTGDGLTELIAGSNAGGLLYWSTGASTSAEPLPERDRVGMTLAPNPTDEGVTIRFGSEVQGRVEVIDLLGRRVQHLDVDGREVTWDGRSSAGQDAPAGVYVVRLQSSGAQLATATLTRLQ